MNKQANPKIKEGSFSSEECVVLTENDNLTVAVFIKHDDDEDGYWQTASGFNLDGIKKWMCCSEAKDVLFCRKNRIQTFEDFNQGMKRPDRERHMELCGFERACLDWIPDADVTPKSYAKFLARRFAEKTNKSAHVVYWLGARNMDGERGYQFWVKSL